MIRAAALAAVALTAGLLVGAEAARAAPDRPELVSCYDAARDLVQRVARAACAGEVVTVDRADALRAARIRARAARLRGDLRRQDGRGGMRNGSGFLVTPAGHVVTARHVVEDCPQLTVRWPDQSEVAGVPVHLAADRDLAVIRIAGPVATWAGLAAGAPGPGTPVTVAGYPMRGRMTVRPVEVTGAVAGDLRIDGLSGVKMALGLRVHPGLSGGPVAGPDGRVVGVVIAMLDRSAVFQEHGQLPPATAFAEPLADVQALLGAAGVVLPVAAGGGAGGSGQAALAAATVRIDCGADPNRG